MFARRVAQQALRTGSGNAFVAPQFQAFCRPQMRTFMNTPVARKAASVDASAATTEAVKEVAKKVVTGHAHETFPQKVWRMTTTHLAWIGRIWLVSPVFFLYGAMNYYKLTDNQQVSLERKRSGNGITKELREARREGGVSGFLRKQSAGGNQKMIASGSHHFENKEGEHNSQSRKWKDTSTYQRQKSSGNWNSRDSAAITRKNSKAALAAAAAVEEETEEAAAAAAAKVEV